MTPSHDFRKLEELSELEPSEAKSRDDKSLAGSKQGRLDLSIAGLFKISVRDGVGLAALKCLSYLAFAVFLPIFIGVVILAVSSDLSLGELWSIGREFLNERVAASNPVH